MRYLNNIQKNNLQEIKKLENEENELKKELKNLATTLNSRAINKTKLQLKEIKKQIDKHVDISEKYKKTIDNFSQFIKKLSQKKNLPNSEIRRELFLIQDIIFYSLAKLDQNLLSSKE